MVPVQPSCLCFVCFCVSLFRPFISESGELNAIEKRLKQEREDLEREKQACEIVVVVMDLRA